MYQLRDTEDYRDDLEKLSGKHPNLLERLWRTVYYDPATNPYVGQRLWAGTD